MTLFDDVFNPKCIYDMLYFNVKSVLIYPTLAELIEKNNSLYQAWKLVSKTKYSSENDLCDNEDCTYEKYATYYPEFCKIVAITYATVYNENGTLKRSIKKFDGDDEPLILAQFMDVLHYVSSEGLKSEPKFFPILCGHNIVNFDIPLLIKRFLLNRDKLDNKKLPYILKNCLNIKPWESGIMDTINVWKFNAYSSIPIPLMLVAEHLGLKKKIDLLSQDELSRYYWMNIKEKPAETIEYLSLQSATQTNLVIQLVNELRQL